MGNRRTAASIVGALFLWTITLAGAAIMIMSGTGKISGTDPWPVMFAEWRLPAWSLMFVGLTQTLGGLAILVPRVAAYGAGALSVVMTGALIVEITKEPQFGPMIPAALIIVFIVIFLMRRSRAIGPLSRIRS